MSNNLNGRRVAFLADDGVYQSELVHPFDAVKNAGGTAEIVALKNSGSILGVWHLDHGDQFDIHACVDSVSAEDYDALCIPGGLGSPDALRGNSAAVQLVRDFVAAGKPVAAVCHGPQLLIEAGVLAGRTVTSWPTIRTDLQNAGAEWVDQELVVDGAIITSRGPDDLPAFSAKLVELTAESPVRV